MPEKSEIVRILLRPVHRFTVFPNREYAITLGEMAVLQTLPMQRLKGLRQIGLGYLALPAAEHSRLAHSLGTAYWSVRFLEHLRSNGFSESVGDGCVPPGNRHRLDDIEKTMGDQLSLDLLVRLFALVHDMTLLPLGHTLQYQLGYYGNERNNARRAGHCLDGIRKELNTALHSVYEGGEVPQNQLLECLRAHLMLIERLFNFRQGFEEAFRSGGGPSGKPPVSKEIETVCFPLVIDLIAGTFSADLVDFALRDSLGAGMPRTFDEGLGEYLCVYVQPGRPKQTRHRTNRPTRNALSVTPPPLTFRLGVNPLMGHYRHEVVTGILSLQRVRYELAERVFYHEKKLAADAMLDRAVRLIDGVTHAISRESDSFSQPTLLRMGDDEFLTLLAVQEKQALKKRQEKTRTGSKARPIMPELIAGRFFKEAFHVPRLSDLSPRGLRLVKKAGLPETRSDVERQILRQIPELSETDLIFSSRPLSMQAKPSSVLIGWMDGRAAPLMEIARRYGYAKEAVDLADRYQSLWSLSVYLRPEVFFWAPTVKKVCEKLLQTGS